MGVFNRLLMKKYGCPELVMTGAPYEVNHKYSPKYQTEIRKKW